MITPPKRIFAFAQDFRFGVCTPSIRGAQPSFSPGLWPSVHAKACSCHSETPNIRHSRAGSRFLGHVSLGLPCRPSWLQRWRALPPPAPTASPAAARSPRTAAASGVLPPASARSIGRVSRAGPPSSSGVAANSSATRCRSASARRAGATDSPDCRRSRSATAAPRSPGTDGSSAASTSPLACLP